MNKLWKKHKNKAYFTIGLALVIFAFLSINSLVFSAGQGASMCSDFENGDCSIYPGDLVMIALVESPYYDLQQGDILCYKGIVSGEDELTNVCHRFYGFDLEGNVITMGDCDVSIQDTSFIEFKEEMGEVLYRFPIAGALSFSVNAGFQTGLEMFKLILDGNYIEDVGINYN